MAKQPVPRCEPAFGNVPTGGLAEPLRLENPTRIVPGDRVTHLVYDVCTG